jgi:hypothetical protein
LDAPAVWPLASISTLRDQVLKDVLALQRESPKRLDWRMGGLRPLTGGFS